MRAPILWALSLCAVLFPATQVFASGHGPVFGYATPTNSRGEWSIDLGVTGRNSEAGGDASVRAMLSYGFTPHLMLSVSAPAALSKAATTPSRLMSGHDFESDLSWRFHHNPSKVGTRFESTVFGGLLMPGADSTSGVMGQLKRAPGLNMGGATGMASRGHYLWIGGAFARYLEKDGDRRPDVLSYSLVYGYRPPAWRKDSGWDWRLFAEMTGERSYHIRHSGLMMPGTDANQLFLGPSALGIRKNYAIEGGVQFPVYRDVGTLLPRERVRWVVNFSYFIFQHGHNH
jgi:hypothetical protein